MLVLVLVQVLVLVLVLGADVGAGAVLCHEGAGGILTSSAHTKWQTHTSTHTPVPPTSETYPDSLEQTGG